MLIFGSKTRNFTASVSTDDHDGTTDCTKMQFLMQTQWDYWPRMEKERFLGRPLISAIDNKDNLILNESIRTGTTSIDAI